MKKKFKTRQNYQIRGKNYNYFTPKLYTKMFNVVSNAAKITTQV